MDAALCVAVCLLKAGGCLLPISRGHLRFVHLHTHLKMETFSGSFSSQALEHAVVKLAPLCFCICPIIGENIEIPHQ